MTSKTIPKPKRRTGRPSAPPRDLVQLPLRIPRKLRDSLHERAVAETKENSLGAIVTGNALAVRLISEGLARLSG